MNRSLEKCGWGLEIWRAGSFGKLKGRFEKIGGEQGALEVGGSRQALERRGGEL